MFSVRCNMNVVMEESLDNSQRATHKTVDKSQNRELFRLLRMGWKVFAEMIFVVVVVVYKKGFTCKYDDAYASCCPESVHLAEAC